MHWQYIISVSYKFQHINLINEKKTPQRYSNYSTGVLVSEKGKLSGNAFKSH